MKEYCERDAHDRLDILEEAMDRLLSVRVSLHTLGNGSEEYIALLRDMLDNLERERGQCLEEIHAQCQAEEEEMLLEMRLERIEDLRYG